MSRSKYGLSGMDSILNYLRTKGTAAARDELKDLFASQGRPRDNVNGALHWLRKHHHVNDADGVISITWAGRHSKIARSAR
jgi:hypothetical protein